MNTLLQNAGRWKLVALFQILFGSSKCLFHINIHRDKVLRLITSLDTSKAHGCHGISATMIKICDQSIVEPLCCIFERCVETGLYPTQWKEANFIPVHKKGCKQNKCTYRPISLIPVFGKIF